MKVGFVGLGRMGAGMAANLVAAGHDVTVYNRSPEKVEALVERGAKSAAAPGELCDGETVITMLADDAAVEAVTFDETGLLARMHPGAVHISMSTISVALSKRLTAAHEERRQHFVSAPVFGRPDAAAAAKLFIVAAAPAPTLKTCQPLFDAMSQRVFVFGEEPQLANLVKLSGNFLIASVIESLGEAMALVGKAGVDRHQYVEMLTSTLFAAPVYKTYGGLIADRAFKPAGFAAPLGQKDVRLALEAGEELNVPLPLASLLRDRLLALLAQGDETLDWSAIGTLAARDAALKD